MRKNKYYYPLNLLLIYSLTTIFFFLFGPYKYKIENGLYLTLFLVLVHVSLIKGYLRGQKSNGRKFKVKFSSIKATKYVILIVFIYKIVSLIGTGGGDLFRVSLAINDPATAYFESSTKGNISVFNYIDMLFAPLVTIAVTSGVFFWNRIGFVSKLLLTSYILIILLSSIGASVRSSIIAIILNISCGLILSHITGNFKVTYRIKLIASLSCISFVLLFFMYTKNLTENRNTDLFINPVTLESPDSENFLYKTLPNDYSATITGISFYLGHSYYRLSQAISLPFHGTGFGFSNSYFLIENVENITGWGGLKDISYGYRLDKELTDKFGVFWSTTYTWLASDFTFPGVIIFLFFIAYWMAIAMKDTMLDPNIFTIAVFANLFSFIYNLPAVNPLQDGAGIVNFFSIFLIWIFFRKSYGEKED